MKKIKIGLSLFLVVILNNGIAQVNFYEKGSKAFYWGISLSANGTNFAIERQPMLPSNDSFRSVYVSNQPGFNLGLIGNWQFNRYFDLRFLPNMMFGEKQIIYETENNNVIKNRIQTTYISFPVIIRYKSEPIKDLRIFVLGGIRYDYLINPQFRPRDEPDRITLKKDNFSLEYGIGLQYFFPYFIFSPEIKFSHGLNNVLGNDQSIRNQSILRGLYPRGFIISLNFEG